MPGPCPAMPESSPGQGLHGLGTAHGCSCRAQGECGCRVPVGSTTLPFLKLSGDFPEEQFPHVASWVGEHSTNKQSHHRTSIYEGDRVSLLLTSHYTEVPSRATAQQGRAARLAAAAARGRGGMRSSAGRQRGSPRSWRIVQRPPRGPCRPPPRTGQ